MEAKRFIVACGGTGGHIFPGIAVALELRRRGHAVELWMAGRDIEQASAFAWDGPVATIAARGLPAGIGIRSLSGGATLLAAGMRCLLRMRHGRRPAAVLAMGSYASVGPGLAARLLRIPLVLHEANAVPGRAIQFLSRWAATTALMFPEAADHLPGIRVIATGLPLREFGASDNDDDFAGALPHPDGDRFTILITGGSQGAQCLNETATEALCLLHKRGVRFQAIHLTGHRDEESVRRRYRENGVPAVVFGFLKRMDRAYKAAHLAVCRAGAATCAELLAAGLPALLVPLPGAARDHQTANAVSMARTGAADMIAQEDLQPDWLSDYLAENAASPEALARMRDASFSMSPSDASARVADIVESVARPLRCDGDT